MKASASSQGKEPPHYLGHRDRLRERVRTAGIASLADYEALEFFLFRSMPRGDVKPLAKALLARFGSLGAVFAAAPVELTTVKGIGPEVALDLNAVQALVQRVAREAVAHRTVISSWAALLAYVRTVLQHEGREQVRVLFLDSKNQLILDEVLSQGTTNQAAVYPREIVRRALELSAASLILVHNHPSGDPTPSKADISITKEVIEAARPLQISVHDHIVVGRQGTFSLRDKGLI